MAQHGLTQEKSKEILTHGEVRGHPLTKKQRGFFGARAGGVPPKNAPLFPIPNEEGMSGITPQEREPLTGPEGSFVGNPPSGFSGKTGHAFDGQDAFMVKPLHPSQPIADSDFPTDATFDNGTSRHLKTGGIV